MPGEGRLVVKRADLARAVAEWPSAAGESVSWAVVLVNAIPTGGDVRAVREAAKICDRVAVVRVDADAMVAPRFGEILSEAGADVVWVPRALEGDVRVEGVAMASVQATVVVQALTSVLPNVVVLARAEAMWKRALESIAKGLGEIAPLRVVD